MNLGIDMTQQWIATAHISLLLLNSPCCTPKTKTVLVVCILKKTIVRFQESGYYS
jgi:hypothetical protein